MKRALERGAALLVYPGGARREADADEAYELVTGKMQTALSRLASERSMPVGG